jgi:hypothetical protein
MITAIVVLLVLGAGVWFLMTSLDDSDTTTAAPEVEGTGGFVDPPKEESWGEAHFRFTVETEDGDHLNEYFVAEGTEGELLTAATDCVEANADLYYGVSCYAFDSEEALEFAEPDPETGAMANLCWRAFYSDSDKADEGTGAKAGAQYEEEGCP